MNIHGRRIAIMATHGFEQAELTEPLETLRGAGAQVDVIAPDAGEIQGFRHFEKGDAVKVDKTLAEAISDDYDAIVIPGGVHNPDALRINEKAIAFVHGFAKAGKTIAAICHGPWVLVNAGLAKGRTLTSYQTIRVDLQNAGAKVVDQEVVVDGNFITSRQPKDLPAFNRAIIEKLAERAKAEPETVE
ncbi:MAG TPA: type 1 glutamine amidotransferase domain-containing protein [Nevskiaceae bacterium]|nr:type 1 glutamine amidotransferase domain-containing protein [Nevskiaceae bacterium]